MDGQDSEHERGLYWKPGQCPHRLSNEMVDWKCWARITTPASSSYATQLIAAKFDKGIADIAASKIQQAYFLLSPREGIPQTTGFHLLSLSLKPSIRAPSKDEPPIMVTGEKRSVEAAMETCRVLFLMQSRSVSRSSRNQAHEIIQEVSHVSPHAGVLANFLYVVPGIGSADPNH